MSRHSSGSRALACKLFRRCIANRFGGPHAPEAPGTLPPKIHYGVLLQRILRMLESAVSHGAQLEPLTCPLQSGSQRCNVPAPATYTVLYACSACLRMSTSHTITKRKNDAGAEPHHRPFREAHLRTPPRRSAPPALCCRGLILISLKHIELPTSRTN